jgi:hypothetical protein
MCIIRLSSNVSILLTYRSISAIAIIINLARKLQSISATDADGYPAISGTVNLDYNIYEALPHKLKMFCQC